MRTSLFGRVAGLARCLDCGSMEGFRVAPLDLHGRAPQRPVSYCDEKSGPWPASRVSNWRAIGMAAAVADWKRESKPLGLSERVGKRTRHGRRDLDLSPTPPATLLLSFLQPSCLLRNHHLRCYLQLLSSNSQLHRHSLTTFAFGYANPQQQPAIQEILHCLAFFPLQSPTEHPYSHFPQP
jgi:hypothetical protein